MKQEDIEAQILLSNNAPLEDLLGFTPNEFDELLYQPFGENSPVQFRDIDDATLDRIPLFRIAEEYLKIIEREKLIKLTPKGALPKKVMVEVYAKNFLPDEHIESGLIKLHREEDCISIMSARHAVELAGLAKKANGKLSLTKKAAVLLQPAKRQQLFQEFFKAFTSKFSWCFNDGYPDEFVGQIGWAFSAFLLHKFGSEPRFTHFYAQHYFKAVPVKAFVSKHHPPELSEDFFRCYGTRAFYRFFLWFGFVTIVDKGSRYDESDTFAATDLLDKVFEFEE